MPRTTMDGNTIEWRNRLGGVNQLFLEYCLDSHTLTIHNKKVYDERRNFVIETDSEKYNHAFLKDWYPDPDNCPDSLKAIIDDIIHARFDKFNKVIINPNPPSFAELLDARLFIS